jgi:hypothetical protein
VDVRKKRLTYAGMRKSDSTVHTRWYTIADGSALIHPGKENDMQAYGKRAKMREARKTALDEFAALAEHFDLLWLWTLHTSKERYGAKRLRERFRDYIKMYDEFKRRYMTADDSTMCGDRTDTYALKKRLKEIGFDYDAECEEIRKELYGE